MEQTGTWTQSDINRETQRILDELCADLLRRLSVMTASLRDNSVHLRDVRTQFSYNGRIAHHRRDFHLDQVAADRGERLFCLVADLEKQAIELKEFNAEEQNWTPTLAVSVTCTGDKQCVPEVDGREQTIPDLGARIMADFSSWVKQAPTARPLAAQLIAARQR